MNYTGGNQSVVDLPDVRVTHDMPGPFRMTVRGFSRYAETVQSLPLLERVKLSIVTDFVLDSYLPGNLPIVGIKVIGHADTDPDRERREPGSVKRISEQRADGVMRSLQADISQKSWLFRIRVGPSPDQIHWHSTGVGSTQPDEENVRRQKTHANMTEADRKLNRRVQVVLEPGPTPIPKPNPQPKPTDPRELFWQAMQKWIDNLHTKQPPNNWHPWHWLPGPKNRSEYIAFKCMMLEQLKVLDVDTALSTLQEVLPDDPTETPEWTTSLRKLAEEIEKRKREMEKEWWRDEDCGGPQPDPVKTLHLTVSPLTVVVKRGGQANITVTALNRPKSPTKQPIEVELRSLPEGVTMMRRQETIPEYVDSVEVRVTTSANAPLGTGRAVHAFGFLRGSNGLAVTSNMITVVVQAP